jgi:hypothetical protein
MELNLYFLQLHPLVAAAVDLMEVKQVELEVPEGVPTN